MAGTTTLAAGTLLASRYRVDRLLAEGGMSTIYVVFDTNLDRNGLVAKELDPIVFGHADPQTYLDLFRAEGRLLAPLKHHRIPRVFQFFEQAGRCYLVMDLVDGEDYRTYLARQGQLSIAEVLELGMATADVLTYLHDQSPPILHRDLKPANLIRQWDGELKVIDFGIAKAIPQQLLGKTAKMTMNLGSPGYAAPERFFGRSSVQSDLYALGAILHQALSGHDPTQPSAPFQFADLGVVRSDVPARLGALIASLVDVTEVNRPASASVVLSELTEIRSRLPGANALTARQPVARPASVAAVPRPQSHPSAQQKPLPPSRRVSNVTITDHPVTVPYDKTIAQLRALGHYDWENSDITDRNFPRLRTSGSGSITIQLVHFNYDIGSDQAITELDRLGLRPATLPELLALGIAEPDLQRSFPIVALGSVWSGPDGDCDVPYLVGDGSLRALDLGWWTRVWGARCRFAAVAK